MGKFPPGSYGSAPTTRPQARQQPQQTYTTAGTIYNPSSLQPLQAPTRRSRTIKWTTAASNPDLSLLPRSLLHSITGYVNSPEQHVVVPQYSPLQQNYDRAIDPMKAALYTSDGADMRAGSESATDGSESTPTSEVFATDRNDTDEEEERLQALMSSMTVKSLHNLASYPNPNQRFAQRALNSQAARARSSARPSQESRTSYKPINRALHCSLSHGGVYRIGQMSPSARTQVESVGIRQDGSPDAMADDKTQSLRNARSSQKLHVGRLSYSEVAGSGRQGAAAALASSTGVPRPLTAGPPGQRQYRPATFLSTLKALNPTEGTIYPPRAKTQTDVYEDSLASMNDIRRPFSAAAAFGDHHTYSQQYLNNSRRMMRDDEKLYNPYKLQPLPANAWDMMSPYGAQSPITRTSISEDDTAIDRGPIRRIAGGMTKYEEHINELWYSGSRALDQIMARLDGELRSVSIDAGCYSSGLDGCDAVLAMALGSLTRAVEEMSAGPASQVDETIYQLPHMPSGSSQCGSASDTSLLYTH